MLGPSQAQNTHRSNPSFAFRTSIRRPLMRPRSILLRSVIPRQAHSHGLPMCTGRIVIDVGLFTYSIDKLMRGTAMEGDSERAETFCDGSKKMILYVYSACCKPLQNDPETVQSLWSTSLRNLAR